MGVHPATSFLAWFLENVAVMAVGSAALAVVLKASGIFAHSNAFIVFLFLLDFGVSVVMLSYLLSACFRRAPTAAFGCSLLYMASFLPYVVLLVLRSRLSAAAQTLLVSARLCKMPKETELHHPQHTSPGPFRLRPSGLLSAGALQGAGSRQPRIHVSPLTAPPGETGRSPVPWEHAASGLCSAPGKKRNSIAIVA